MSEFVSVAEASSLPPGKGRTVSVKGREFAVYNLGGRFYAMDDACPHRGASLGEGLLVGGEVFCPLHGWAFNLESGRCLNNPDKPVKMYPTRVVDGWVQIMSDL